MNHTTRRYPLTSREAFGLDATEATAIHFYRTPLHKRVLSFWCRYGLLFFVVGLAAAVLLEIT